MSSFINIWTLLAAMVFSVILGFVWYGPLFGKSWMKLSGIVMPDQKPGFAAMLKPMILSFIGAVLMATVLSFVIAFHDSYYATSGLAPALSIAVMAWLGFIVPLYLNLSGWEGKPWTLFFINTGYWLVYLLAIASFITILA
jgi:hypothetical protein